MARLHLLGPVYYIGADLEILEQKGGRGADSAILE